MWLRNDFYTSPGLSIVVHGDYPPILQLFQLIWCKLAGFYREGFLYMALELTCFSMLFPTLKNLVWKSKKRVKTIALSFLILLSFLALPVTLDVTHIFYNSLHPDYAIAFVFVLGVFLAVTQSKKIEWSSAIMLSLVVTFLCLTKQSSILFGGLVGLIYISGLYLSYKPKIKSLFKGLWAAISHWRKTWLSVFGILLLLTLPLVSLKLWAAQVKGYESPYCCVAIFHIEPKDVLKLPGVLLKKAGNESQQTYARAFFPYILTSQAGFTTHILNNMSYMQFVLLFVGIMIFVGYNYKDKYRRHKLVATAAIITLGWFIYCFAIYLTFLFGGMIDVERDNMATGDRYLRTYVFAMLLVLFAMLISYIIRRHNGAKDKGKTLAIFAFLFAVAVSLLINIEILRNRYLVENIKFKWEYSAYGIQDVNTLAKRMRAFAKAAGGTYEDPKKILYTDQVLRKTVYLMRYYAIPNKVENGNDLVIDDKMTPGKLCSMLRTNDFLWVNHEYNDARSLTMINSCLTNKIDKLDKYGAYKIERDGEKLRLVEWRF
jgi:hypothetical protein